MDKDVSTDEESTSTAKKSKYGPCEVCATQEAKYCCPRCEVKTCSLNCSRIHKKEVECDGIRDRTKFIAMNEFTNLDLSSDYRLLEEISRVVDASKKDRFRQKFRFSRRFFLLQQQSQERRTSLKFLPSTFQRHKNNTTIYDTTKKIILWHVDWIFVHSNNLKISEKVPENVKISTILRKYLMKQECEELQEQLQHYQAADLPGMRILLKAEQQKSGKRFYDVDPSHTLRDLLKNKVIIEYPTIHLMFKEQAMLLNVIDSDDEDCDKNLKQLNSGKEVINKIINKSESDDSLYNSMRNLLFLSEYSDDEDGE